MANCKWSNPQFCQIKTVDFPNEQDYSAVVKGVEYKDVVWWYKSPTSEVRTSRSDAFLLEDFSCQIARGTFFFRDLFQNTQSWRSNADTNYAKSAPIAGHICFYNEKVDMYIDGVKEE